MTNQWKVPAFYDNFTNEEHRKAKAGGCNMLVNGECLDVNYLSVVIIFFLEGICTFWGCHFFVCFIFKTPKFVQERNQILPAV